MMMRTEVSALISLNIVISRCSVTSIQNCMSWWWRGEHIPGMYDVQIRSSRIRHRNARLGRIKFDFEISDDD